MSASHRLQFLPNSSSRTGPYHGMQSFRNSLFQCRASIGSQVLPENSPLCAPLFTGPQHLAEALASPWGQSILPGHLPAPLWASMGCRGTAFLTMVFTTSFRGKCFGTWNTSSLFSTDFGICRAVLHILTLLSTGHSCSSQ